MTTVNFGKNEKKISLSIPYSIRTVLKLVIDPLDFEYHEKVVYEVNRLKSVQIL